MYHGLDKKMRFQSFREYFNGPISTTPALNSGMIRNISYVSTERARFPRTICLFPQPGTLPKRSVSS